MGTLQTEVLFSYEEIQSLTEKCLNFAELLTAREFRPYQKEMAHAIVIDVLGNLGNSLTGLFSRQSGKSETVANVAAALMVILPKLANLRDGDKFVFPQLRDYKRGFWVGIFSPSNTQSSTTYKRLRDRVTSVEGKEILSSSELALDGMDSLWPPVANTNSYLELNNGSFCLMMSADKKTNIESKTFHLILLDEAQDLDEFVVQKSILPMGTETNSTVVATGTPGTTKSYFYNTIQHNLHEQLKRGAARSDSKLMPQLHFEYDYKVVQKYSTNYRKFVQKQKKKMGEDSDEFMMAYRLIWLLERGMAITADLFDELTIKSLNIKTEYKQEELVAGLDWGKSSDSTVLTIGRPLWDQVDDQGRAPCEVINWYEKVGDDYESIFAEVKDELDKYSVKTLAADSTGTGEPLADRLIYELPHITVLPIKFSSQQKDHLYKFFLLMLQEKKVWWPGESHFVKRKKFLMFKQQMLNLQKEYKGQYLSCHAPEDQRTAHDDFPDSLALMLWCINEEALPYIQVSDGSDIYKGAHRYGVGSKSEFSLR